MSERWVWTDTFQKNGQLSSFIKISSTKIKQDINCLFFFENYIKWHQLILQRQLSASSQITCEATNSKRNRERSHCKGHVSVPFFILFSFGRTFARRFLIFNGFLNGDLNIFFNDNARAWCVGKTFTRRGILYQAQGKFQQSVIKNKKRKHI